MADVYLVTAPYVTPKLKDANGAWTHRGVYEGARINADDIEPASLEHHVESGLMRLADDDAPATVEVEPVVEASGSEPGELARPAGNASLAAWLDYAVAQRPEGMTEDEARETYGSKTRNELAALFG